MAEEVQIKTNLDNAQAIDGLVKMEKQVQNSAKSVDGMNKSTQSFQQQMKALNKELSTITLDEQISKVNKIFKETPQSVKTLTAEVEQYTSIAIRAGRETPIGREFLKKAADARDKLTDVTNEVNRLSQDGQKLQGALQGIGVAAGGFAIAQSGAALFGEENEELQKQIIKVTAAMNALQGVEQIRLALEKESALRLQINNALEKIRSLEIFKTTGALGANTAATAASNTAQKAFAVSTLFSNKALKAFKVALVGTGIGAIVVGLGLLIANFDDVKVKVQEAIKSFHFLALGIETVTKVLQALGVVQSEESQRLQKLAQLQIENLQKEQEAIEGRYGFEIEQARAAGKTTVDLEKDKRAATAESLKAQANAIVSLVKLSGEFTEDQKTRLKEITDLAKKLKQDDVINTIKVEKEKADAEKKAADERRKAGEAAAKEREAKQKEEAAELLAIAGELETLRIASIEDATERELAALDQKFDSRIEKLKAGNEKEIELAVALEQEKARLIADVEKKAAEEKTARELEAANLKRENERLLAETELEIQEAKATTEEEKALAKKESDKEAANLEFEEKLLLLEERGLLTQELEGEIEIARQTSLAEIEKQFELDKAEREEQNKINAIKRAEEERNNKIAIASTTANALSSITGSLEALGVKNAGLNKALAIGQIAIDTAKGISAAVASGASMPFPANIPAILAGVAAVISGIVSAKKALSKAQLPAGAGGGGGNISIPSAPSIAAAPTIDPGAGLGAGGVVGTDNQTAGTSQTVKAFVVETEITDQQAATKLIDEKSELT